VIPRSRAGSSSCPMKQHDRLEILGAVKAATLSIKRLPARYYSRNIHTRPRSAAIAGKSLHRPPSVCPARSRALQLRGLRSPGMEVRRHRPSGRAPTRRECNAVSRGSEPDSLAHPVEKVVRSIGCFPGPTLSRFADRRICVQEASEACARFVGGPCDVLKAGPREVTRSHPSRWFAGSPLC